MAAEEEKKPEETTAPAEAEAQENQPADNAAENSEPEDQAETTPEGKSVRPYDFRRPQHLSGDQMRSLQRLPRAAAKTRLSRENMFRFCLSRQKQERRREGPQRSESAYFSSRFSAQLLMQ